MIFETLYDNLTSSLFLYEVDYDTSPTKLFLNIESEDWEGTIKRSKTHPQEAQTWVKRVNEFEGQLWMVLPLHAAIISHAPVSVIEALLEAYPGGALETDDIQNLPLHLVSNNFDPDDDVIYALYEAYPEAIFKKNRNQGLSLCDYDCNCPPLFKLIQERKWEKALKHAQNNEDEVKTWVLRREDCGKVRWRLLPLHAAIIFDAPGEVVNELLKHFPMGAKCIDDEGMTPLQRQLGKRIHNTKIVESLVKAMLHPQPFVTYSEKEHHCADFEEDCPKLYNLIQKQDWEGAMGRVCTNPEEAQTWVERKSRRGDVLYRHLPIHVALGLKPPSIVVEALLTGYRDGIRCYDDKGLLPFHIAILNQSRDVVNVLIEALENPINVCMKDPKGDVILTDYDVSPTALFELIESESWSDCIDHLKVYPEEAKTWTIKKHPDGSLKWRLLPIHAAIINDAPCAAIVAILEAYKDGAKCRENQGLLPIQLAQWKNSRLDVIETLMHVYPEGANMKSASTPYSRTFKKGVTRNAMEYPPNDNIQLHRTSTFTKCPSVLQHVAPLFRRTPSGLRASPSVFARSRSMSSVPAF